MGEANQATGNSVFSDESVKTQIVLNNINEGVVILDNRGIIQLFNPAAEAITGWKAQDAVSLDYRSIMSLYNNADHLIEDAENPLVQCMNRSTTFTNDRIWIRTVSGRRVQISLKASPIINGSNNNSPLGVVMVFRDITREHAEQNAETDFISTASHEMRTPVATIEGYLGMILNPKICTIDDKARDYANKAHTAVKHLGHLFKDLLDVTKADDSRLQMRPVLIDATEAVREVTEDFQDRAHKKKLLLNFLPDQHAGGTGSIRTITPPSIIYVDLDYFNEAIGNIIENAIKYTPSGNVNVNVQSNGKKVHISVKDSGIGIPKEEIPHLFQKFYRVDNRETREIGGTGLGLYLIKKLTISMGGNIGVDSQYGRGSTFWVEFDSLDRAEAIKRAREIKAREVASDPSKAASARGTFGK